MPFGRPGPSSGSSTRSRPLVFIQPNMGSRQRPDDASSITGTFNESLEDLSESSEEELVSEDEMDNQHPQPTPGMHQSGIEGLGSGTNHPGNGPNQIVNVGGGGMPVGPFGMGGIGVMPGALGGVGMWPPNPNVGPGPNLPGGPPGANGGSANPSGRSGTLAGLMQNPRGPGGNGHWFSTIASQKAPPQPPPCVLINPPSGNIALHTKLMRIYRNQLMGIIKRKHRKAYEKRLREGKVKQNNIEFLPDHTHILWDRVRTSDKPNGVGWLVWQCIPRVLTAEQAQAQGVGIYDPRVKQSQ